MNIHGKNLDILFETVLPYAFTFSKVSYEKTRG